MLFRNCVFDFGYTGDESFVASAHVTIVAASAAEDTSADFSRPREGPILELVALLEAGAFEARYQSDGEEGVFARRPITVTPLEVSLDAPNEVPAGASFEVEWTGPDGPLNYITIVHAGAAAGTHLNCKYTREGSPLTLGAPEEAGTYEVRYQSDRAKDRIFASRQIRVQ